MPGGKPAKKKLTPKQRAFVREYMVDRNATQAAIRAGYSAKWANRQAHQLLDKTRLRAAIEVAEKKRDEEAAVDANWIEGRLVENVERSMQHTPVFDKAGKPTGEYTYRGSVANEALKTLARIRGLLRERIEVDPGEKMARIMEALQRKRAREG